MRQTVSALADERGERGDLMETTKGAVKGSWVSVTAHPRLRPLKRRAPAQILNTMAMISIPTGMATISVKNEDENQN
jgi:hypothetical protein